MKDWTETKLESLISFSNGRTSPSRDNGGQIPVYGSNGIIGFSSEFNAPAKTIIVGRVGSYCGSLYLASKDCWVTDNAIRANAKGENDPVFLYFLLTTLNLNDKRAGSGQPLLNQSILNSIPVKIPGPREQTRIAKILSSLNDKIELNRQMNATLEAMARALFKAWFVDFEPVHANLENRPSSSASPDIARLFSSEFENDIPVGWEERPVGELLKYTIGGDWGTDEETEKNGNQVCIVRGTDIPNLKNGNFDTAPVRFVQSSKLEKRELIDGDIVIEVSGGSRDQATGRSLYFTDKLLENFRHKVVPASFCRLFRGVNAKASLLIGVYLQVLYDEGGTWEYQTQSTGISNFQTTHFLGAAKIAIPNDLQILTEFYKIVRPMIEKQQSYESARLREIRDFLLPRLITGKIRVGDRQDEALEEIG